MQNSAGATVGLGAAIPHVVYGDGVVYTASATFDTTVGGVTAKTSNMTSSVLGGDTAITVSAMPLSYPGP